MSGRGAKMTSVTHMNPLNSVDSFDDDSGTTTGVPQRGSRSKPSTREISRTSYDEGASSSSSSSTGGGRSLSLAESKKSGSYDSQTGIAAHLLPSVDVEDLGAMDAMHVHVPESFVFDQTRYDEWRENQERERKSLQTNDSERLRLRHITDVWMSNNHVLAPESIIRRRWDVVQIFALAYVAVAVPYRIGFDHDTEPSDPYFWFDLVVDFYFIADIFLSFRTAYYNGNGVLMFYPSQIGARYLRGWFSVDVASCLPLNYLTYLPQNQFTHYSQYRMLRLLRLLKLLRLARFNRLIRRYQEEFYNLMTSFRIIKIIFCLLLIAHWLGCAWFYVGSYDTVLCTNEPQAAGYPEGVCDALAKEGMRAPDGDILRGWVFHHFSGAASNATYSNKYTTAMYWAMMTMTTVGYGDISATTQEEMTMSVLSMVLGGLVFGFILGNLSEISRRLNPGETIKEKQISKLSKFLWSRGVDTDLARRIRAYYLAYYNSRSAVETIDMFKRLPMGMRDELVIQLGYASGYKIGATSKSDGILDKVPFLSGVGGLAQLKLCLKLKRGFYTQQIPDVITGLVTGYIMREGDSAKEMFVVEEGEVVVEVNEVPQEPKLGTGDFFGELCVLVSRKNMNKRRVYTRNAYAATNCMIGLLSTEDLMELAEEEPSIKIAMAKSIAFAESNTERHLALMRSTEPAREGYMLLNKQEHGWLPTVVVPGAESGGLLADAAHAAMHATRTVKDQVASIADDATGGRFTKAMDAATALAEQAAHDIAHQFETEDDILKREEEEAASLAAQEALEAADPDAWRSVYIRVKAGTLTMTANVGSEATNDQTFSLVNVNYATSSRPVQGQGFVFQLQTQKQNEVEQDANKAAKHMLTCAVGTSKKLKSWLRVINSNSKTRLSAEMSQGGLFCPTEGVPTEEYYIPSNAEKLQKLGERIDAVQGDIHALHAIHLQGMKNKLGNMERMLCKIAGEPLPKDDLLLDTMASSVAEQDEEGVE